MHASTPHTDGTPIDAPSPRRSRLTVDAPTRAFHWLFALCFAGAWLTAESERWRQVHETLGYTFGGLLAFRLVYGLIGPRQVRLGMLWRRASGWRELLGRTPGAQLKLQRVATLGLGTALIALLAVAAPLVLSGHAGQADWWGLADPLEELHELFANAAMALVLAHLGLIALLSVWRRRNLAAPMLTGRTPGPGGDVVKANRLWLGALVLAACGGFVGWQLSQPPGTDQGGTSADEEPTASASADAGHRDDDEDEDD